MERFHSALGLALCNTSRFVLEARGLGIFVERSPVLHVRWKINEELYILRNRIHECLVDLQKEGTVSGYQADLNWLPKTTLAFRDTSYDNLPLVLNSIQGIDLSGSVQVDKLSTYKYSLKHGESLTGETKLKT